MIHAALLALLPVLGPLAGPQRLDETARAAVDELVAPWDRDDSPGGCLAVLLDGEPVLVRAFGMADLDGRSPVTPDTRFYLASLAKPFTAACAVHAAREGALELDASVLEVFPELPDAYRPATLRHLLHHVSGIPDVYDAAIVADLGPEPLGSNGAALELLRGLPRLCFRPGTRLLYSNSGYVLLAEALRRRADADLAAYARRVLFEPLGMSRAGWLGEEAAAAGERARSYVREGSGWRALRVVTGLRGPGGMVASLEDLVRFERAWHAGRVGGSDLRPDLLRAPASARHVVLGRYAAGWMLQRLRGLRVERHYGGAFGYSSDLLRFPDQGVTVIALANAADLEARELATGVAEIVLGDSMEPAPAPPAPELDAEEAARFGRTWRSPSDELWILTPRGDGEFVVSALGDVKLALRATGPTRLEALDAQLPFALELEGEGRDERLVVRREGREPLRLERLPFPAVETTPSAEVAGTYANGELDAWIALEAAPGGRLRLVQERPLLSLPDFLPVARDLFLCDRGARLAVHRDEEGRVHALTLDGNRAWGIGFERVE